MVGHLLARSGPGVNQGKAFHSIGGHGVKLRFGLGQQFGYHVSGKAHGQQFGLQLVKVVHGGVLRQFFQKLVRNPDAHAALSGAHKAIRKAQQHGFKVFDHGAGGQPRAQQHAAVGLLLFVVGPGFVVLGTQVGKTTLFHGGHAESGPLHQPAQPPVFHRQPHKLARRTIVGAVRHVQKHVLAQHTGVEVGHHLVQMGGRDLEVAVTRVGEVTRPGNGHPALRGALGQLHHLAVKTGQARHRGATITRPQQKVPPLRRGGHCRTACHQGNCRCGQ